MVLNGVKPAALGRVDRLSVADLTRNPAR
jgi:hypothetical protein